MTPGTDERPGGPRDGTPPPPANDDQGRPVPPSDGEPAARTEDPESGLRKLAGRMLRGSEQDKLWVVEDATRKHSVSVYVQGNLLGDIFGGSKLHGAEGRGGAARAGPVAQHLLDKVREVYVRPQDYGVAQRLLRQQRLVVLQGRPHWGKATMALHLLDGIGREDPAGLRGIERFGSEIDLVELDGTGIAARQGYLVDTLAPHQAGRLTDDRVERLLGVLLGRDSHAVITVDQAVRLPQGLVRELVVGCQEALDPALLLRRHLRWHLRMRKGDALAEVEPTHQDRLLACEQVQAELLETPLPRELDRIAHLLAGVLCGDDEAETLGQLRRQSASAIQDHFRDEVTSLQDRAFMIALAVLDGAPYEAVAEAAEHLEEGLHRVGSPEEPLGRDPFGVLRDERLDRAQARIVQQQDGSGPAGTMQAVTFRNPVYPRSLLVFVWREYDAARVVLLGWLEELSRQRELEIPLRTAVALATLGAQAFPYVHARVLEPWAASGDKPLQEVAALALSTLVDLERELAPDILELLEQWCDAGQDSDRDERERQWTAATALGWHVGASYPDMALRQLERMAGLDDLDLALTVARSVTRLFDAGKRREVLDALVAWTEVRPHTDEDRALTRTAVLCFLRIAATSLSEPPKAGLEEERWPTLLWLTDGAVSGDAAQAAWWLDRVATLWRRALDTWLVVDVALAVLHDWLELTGKDDRLLPFLRRLLPRVPADDRGRRRLDYNLRRWAEEPVHERDGQPLSRVARELLRSLREEGRN